MDGNPVTLSPGKYLVEQAGPTELRVTTVSDKKEFLIQAEALSHEQYELFSPMALTRPSKNQEVLIDLYLPGGVRLEARGSSKELPKLPPTPEEPEVAIIPDPELPALPRTPHILDPPPSAPTMIQSPPLISYHAPSPDQPGLRIDGESPDTQYPSVYVLAPSHVGHTSQKHPVLYWYLSQSAQHPMDVMIAEEGHFDVLLDIRLLPPLQAGIHELRLKDYGISLLPKVPYQWTVRIMNPQASETLTASGVIQRINAPAGSSTSLLYSPEDYAQKGQWYDALTALTLHIQDNPENPELLAQRASLLEQVGLTEAAAFVQKAKTP
jgi:hypothetical protein